MKKNNEMSTMLADRSDKLHFGHLRLEPGKMLAFGEDENVKLALSVTAYSVT